MKLALALSGVLLASLALSTGAGATPPPQTYSPAQFRMAETPPDNTMGGYSAFGNTTVPDCQYVADANLIQYAHPSAIITTAEVEVAWQSHPVYVYWDNFIPLNFLESTGFDGVTISSYQRIYTDAQVALGANAGGVYAFLNLNQPLYHAVAVVGSNSVGPVVVWVGTPIQLTWAWYDAKMVVEYAVTW